MADGFPKSVGMNRQQPMVLFPSNLYFDTQFRHRTGVHSDADSPLARGPLRPLTTAMYSISRRAGPLIGLAPPGSFRRIFISVIFFRIPCSRRPPAPRLRAAACGVPVRRTTWRSCLTQFTGKIIFDFTGKFDISQAKFSFRHRGFHTLPAASDGPRAEPP